MLCIPVFIYKHGMCGHCACSTAACATVRRTMCSLVTAGLQQPR